MPLWSARRRQAYRKFIVNPRIWRRVIDRLRERITVIAEADWVTHELLIAVTARLEQLYWMWQAEVKP